MGGWIPVLLRLLGLEASPATESVLDPLELTWEPPTTIALTFEPPASVALTFEPPAVIGLTWEP